MAKRHEDGRNLLARVLDTPDLVVAVQSLEPSALGALVERVGLEDGGEIMALASAEQLLHMFDELLWESDAPGVDERFDPARFAVWLEVMLEAGDVFAAERLTELPEELVIAAFHSQLLVIDMNELGVQMSYARRDDAEATERLLECGLSQEIGEYLLLSKRYDGFDAVVAVLTALDRDHHDLLERVLERCCAASAAFIEDNGGLYEVLSSEEMLAADAAADREDRRARLGFVSPSSAAAFLKLAALDDPDAVASSRSRDAVTQAYFRELEARAVGAARPRAAGGEGRAASELVGTLRELGVVKGEAPPLLTGGLADPFRGAMIALSQRSPEKHAARMAELAYLANVLSSGASLDGRRYLPLEAATTAVDVCAEGLEYLVARGRLREKEPVEILSRIGADKLFRIGWRLRG
jgi:hypothetical protein